MCSKQSRGASKSCDTAEVAPREFADRFTFRRGATNQIGGQKRAHRTGKIRGRGTLRKTRFHSVAVVPSLAKTTESGGRWFSFLDVCRSAGQKPRRPSLVQAAYMRIRWWLLFLAAACCSAGKKPPCACTPPRACLVCELHLGKRPPPWPAAKVTLNFCGECSRVIVPASLSPGHSAIRRSDRSGPGGHARVDVGFYKQELGTFDGVLCGGVDWPSPAAAAREARSFGSDGEWEVVQAACRFTGLTLALPSSLPLC